MFVFAPKAVLRKFYHGVYLSLLADIAHIEAGAS
jgi:hypothetical protein